ncbi:MAG: hypothetical protein IH620_03660 [Ignavibacterium sp.]|nr:hypothetical protein [Ignavibacterium sp.]
MKLLQPAVLSGEILNLFDESDEKVVIVSPYVKIDKWHKLKKKLTSLKSKNIEVEFYIRDDKFNTESYEQVRNIGFDPIGIPDLHTKLYMNEKTAIVTSMNLLYSSEINSLDIGYKTQTTNEYDELLDYYNRYLKRNPTTINYGSSFDWRDQLYDLLAKNIGELAINGQNNNLHIQTRRNNYDCFIASEYGKNNLRISGILTNDEYYRLRPQLHQINSRLGLKLELIAGNGRHYDSIWCTLASGLKSFTIDDILKPEQDIAVNSIIKFVTEVERIKSEKDS